MTHAPLDLVLTLTRDDNTVDGVFGVLRWPDGYELQTGEDDWKGNRRGQSCIPAGHYRLRRTIYHKYGVPTFEITGVPGRTRCLVHWGNTEEDVEGCVYVGLSRGRIPVTRDEDTGEVNKVKRAVLQSRVAFKQFMERMRGIDECGLDVVWAEGLPGEPHD